MGIVINSSTGEIDVAASTPGTYRITYTTNGDCPNSSTQDITINALPTISISASSTSICAGDSVTLTASGAGAGGTYSWSDGQSTAAITVTPAATITYSVTGTDANGCFNTASQQITVTATETATVQYAASSYCIMPTVPGAQNVNGYYPMFTTASAANAYSNDGQSHSHYIGGTYYYMPGASASSTPGVVLFHPPSNPYTPETDQPTVTGATGGTFTKHAGSGTLSINSTTGVINLQASDAGTYTVRYTSPGTCAVNVDNTITVNALDGATFAYSSNSLPQTGTASLTTTPTTSGGVFSAYPSGLSINSSTGEIDLAASTIQSYKIFYETSGAGCPNSSTFDLAVTASGISNVYSMDFNPADSTYIKTGKITSLDTGDFSISIWLLRRSGQGNIQYVISNSSASALAGFDIITFREQVKFDRRTLTKQASTGYQTIGLSYNTWHNIVGTYNDSTGDLKLYLDGVLKTTASATSDSNSASLDLNLGRATDGSYLLNGRIDEVGIWNTALTSTQVAEIYNATGNNLTKDLSTVAGGPVYWNRMGDN